MDLKLKDCQDACEEMGLCLALKCCDNYFYAISKKSTCWLIHFDGKDEKCGLIDICTEWNYVDGEFFPYSPKRLFAENTSKEQLKKELNEMFIKLKKAIVQKKKNDIEQDF